MAYQVAYQATHQVTHQAAYQVTRQVTRWAQDSLLLINKTFSTNPACRHQ